MLSDNVPDNNAGILYAKHRAKRCKCVARILGVRNLRVNEKIWKEGNWIFGNLTHNEIQRKHFTSVFCGGSWASGNLTHTTQALFYVGFLLGRGYHSSRADPFVPKHGSPTLKNGIDLPVLHEEHSTTPLL
uniref:SFRICE_038490 n=1 Tax=Spodoptera frugiperda TaxID=7108 RepID=A0A2H1WAJ2_SPOFR